MKQERTQHVKTINNELDAWEKGIVYYLDYILEYRFDFHDQLKYIQDVDIVIPYENLKNDFYIIQDLTKCYSPLVQSVHTYKTKAVTNMSKQYLDCINKHFEKEIDFFQYTP